LTPAERALYLSMDGREEVGGEMKRVVVNWSGGKDAALCLQELLATPGHEVVGLLTTVTEEEDRVTLHGTPLSLVRRQAAALELPLEVVRIPTGADNDTYLLRQQAVLERLKKRGVHFFAFGDVALADVRAWREMQLARAGLQGLFPIWRRNSRELLRDFVRQGWRAVSVCVDGDLLGEEWLGRPLDETWLADLPEGIEAAGEGGAYHTFVWDGPLFRRPVGFRTGGVVREGAFARLDLEPVEEEMENR
jgi:uncharacterized protein (TIGR00290 family)